MHDIKWSEAEKQIARRVFNAALQAELAEIMSNFKVQAATIATPDEMWAIQDFLFRKRREIDEKYDYRYSQLLLVFARLVREKRVREEELQGLSAEKLSYINRILSL